MLISLCGNLYLCFSHKCNTKQASYDLLCSYLNFLWITIHMRHNHIFSLCTIISHLPTGSFKLGVIFKFCCSAHNWDILKQKITGLELYRNRTMGWAIHIHVNIEGWTLFSCSNSSRVKFIVIFQLTNSCSYPRYRKCNSLSSVTNLKWQTFIISMLRLFGPSLM